MKKGGVQAFSLNRLRNSIILSDSLYDDSYKPKPTREVRITYPKHRVAYANAFVDRVYQRSLNDGAVYPQMSRQFIKENMACQKGKGTDMARELFKEMLHSMWIKFGTDFWILQCDVKKYYDNMVHECTDNLFYKGLDEWTFNRTTEVLHNQYSGTKGYHPGSQMVQIAGISYLSSVDHYVKERLRIKQYIRYMDDLLLLHSDYNYLVRCKNVLDDKLSTISLWFHPEKTRILNPKKGILFLGFIFKVSDSGKVIMTCDPKKVKTNRVKLRRMVNKARRGKLSREDCDNSLECIIAHMSKGNTYKSIKQLKDYYKKLWED